MPTVNLPAIMQNRSDTIGFSRFIRFSRPGRLNRLSRTPVEVSECEPFVEVYMFAIGERVMHPGQGLCTVVGFEDSPFPVLVLEAGDGRSTTKLLYPQAQADKLHPPVSREDALAVIEGYDDLTCDDFTDRNSGLEEKHFKALLKNGVPDSVRVVKTMRQRIAAAEAEGKKPSVGPLRSSRVRSTPRPMRSSRCSRRVATTWRMRLRAIARLASCVLGQPTGLAKLANLSQEESLEQIARAHREGTVQPAWQGGHGELL